jgi:2-polyprenyl-6-methoxyphenol hydroxylase-like FAD-dependent oxidoreductase
VSRRLQIAIVGHGIAGAALALQLGRRGHEVDCFERSSAAANAGAGLLLAPPALALLDALGLGDAARQSGAAIHGVSATSARGRVLLDWDARRWGHPVLGVGIRRQMLHGILACADAATATLHHGIGIASVDAERGVLIDASGERFGPFDLVLACDGAHSTLRAARLALIKREQAYRWTALSCLMRSDRAASTVLVQRFSGGHHLSSWAVGGPDAGGAVPICVSVNLPPESASRLTAGDDWRSVLQRAGLAAGGCLDSLDPVGPWIPLSCTDAVLRRYCLTSAGVRR